MKRRRTRPEARGRAADTARPAWMLRLVAAFALVVPLCMIIGEDPFRGPKELLVRLEAIALATAFLWGLLLRPGGRPWREIMRQPWVLVTFAAVAWSALTAISSQNRVISLTSLAYIGSMAVVFAGTVLAMRRASIVFAAIPLAPAAVNVGVVLLQQLHVWSPVAMSRNPWVPTGLVGNSGDTGCYFMVASLGAAALALSSPRWRRIAAVAALAFALGTFVTATLTAAGALVVGLVVLAAMRSPRLVLITVLLVTMVGLLGLAFSPPAQGRATRLVNSVAHGNLDQFFSFRLTAYATAWLMFRDHPLVGVGPGAFGFEYYDYRALAEERFPSLRQSMSRMFIFTEAHNDHLQVLAQTGIPGYAVFLAALVLLARLSLGGRDAESEERRFSRALGLPLAVAFGVMTLAQFPLELVAVLHTALYYAAAAMAWRERA